jgi:carboxymethylenebutenolidase
MERDRHRGPGCGMSEKVSRENITSSAGEAFTGLYCRPEGAIRGAILLVQEIFGINENMRLTASSFAARGYAVLVPDLFWRFSPGLDLDPTVQSDRDEAMKYNSEFDDELGVGDLRASVERLKSLANTESVASVGYCLGGRLSFALGKEGAVSAAVSYYGVALQKYFGVRHASRTLVHIATADTLCPEPLQEGILDYAKRFPIVKVIMHEGVGHAFARLGSATYVAATAERAREQTDAFLEAKE